LEQEAKTMKSIKLLCLLLAAGFAVFSAGCGGTSDDTANTATSSTSTTSTPSLKLSSSAFTNGAAIPVKYANTGVSGGLNYSIPLSWSNVPSGTQSFALSMIDISASNFVHWLVLNIRSSANSLAENISGTFSLPTKEYTNDFPSSGYGGPQPPVADGPHSYVITIYALNSDNVSFTDNTNGNNLSAFNSAISGKILEQASITGTFDR
jgi:Raf kinase inhibitor-like YbhB/YbcL family protein